MTSTDVLIVAFLALMVLASFISLKAKVPYTLVLVILGIGLAATSVVSIYVPSVFGQIIGQMKSLFDQLTAGRNGGLFVGLVVPPLIFEAMIHIRTSDLRAVIKPSFVLATIGVVISTLVGGVLLWQFTPLAFGISFLFAAIISPTDVATVLEIFKHARVPSKLSTLMDTEAAFNDATGIVVFTVVLAWINFGHLSLLSAVANFAFVFAGGVLIGLVVAFIAELLTSLIAEKLTETILTISAVYGSYALASSLGMSGLVAVSVVGLYFGNFTIRTAMGPATREAVSIFWEFAAFFGNSVAFLFIGFKTNILQLATSGTIFLVILAYLAVTAARGASVYPILTIFDRLDQKIPLKWRNVAMLGGMRGALSIALAVSIPAALISTSDEALLTTLVLGVAFISISLQAALLFRYIRRAFAPEQLETVDSLNVRLSKAVSAIETLRKLKEEGKVSDEEFAIQLDHDQEELRDSLKEINENVDPKNLVRTRASELYSELTTPVTRARQALKSRRDLKQQHRAEDSIIVADGNPSQPETVDEEETNK